VSYRDKIRYVVEPLLVEDVFVCCTRFLRMCLVSTYLAITTHPPKPTKILRGSKVQESRKACSRQARQWQRAERCPAVVRHRDSNHGALVFILIIAAPQRGAFSTCLFQDVSYCVQQITIGKQGFGPLLLTL